uniref:Ig-like domain-containing protein n=1 Tax=Cyprinus carpio TaxID=7962 RepID=A0A8C1RXF0_CYPCA
MNNIIILIWTLLCCIKGSSGQITVTQTPAVQTAELGKTVVMRCTASTPLTGCTPPCLSWYLQKPGEAPKPLIYQTSSRYTGTPSRFSGVQTEDTGDYYCQSFHYLNSKAVFTQ